MTAWALLPITLATLYVGWHLLGLTFAALEARCSCRKGAICERCLREAEAIRPQARATRTEDMQTNKESEQSVSQ